jgi:hypothetical protein
MVGGVVVVVEVVVVVVVEVVVGGGRLFVAMSHRHQGPKRSDGRQ